MDQQSYEASALSYIADKAVYYDIYSITNDSIAGGNPDSISSKQNLRNEDFISVANHGDTSFSLGGTKTLNGKYVTVHSTGNNSTVKFVVSGTNMQDQSISETIFGSNAGQIVKGFKAFKTVSGVTVDKAAGTVKVGTSGGNITLNGSLTSGGLPL